MPVPGAALDENARSCFRLTGGNRPPSLTGEVLVVVQERGEPPLTGEVLVVVQERGEPPSFSSSIRIIKMGYRAE